MPAAPPFDRTRLHASSSTSRRQIRSYSAWKRRLGELLADVKSRRWSCRTLSTGLLDRTLPVMPSRLPPSVDTVEAEPLPSDAVLVRTVNGTMSPSDSLSTRDRFTIGLSASLCRTSAAEEGLSCSVSGCHRMPSSIPRGSPDPLRLPAVGLLPSPCHDWLGLPAFRLLLSRGCKVHLMLGLRLCSPLCRQHRPTGT